MENISSIADSTTPPPLTVDVTAFTRLRLDELGRLRGVGFAKIEDLRAARDGLAPSPILTPDQIFRHEVRSADRLDRLGRAIRQIMVLEFELLGLFEGPERDNFPTLGLVKPHLMGALDERALDRPMPPARPVRLSPFVRSDYCTGALDSVVAGIRETLGAEPPPDDPFAPGAERKAAERAAAEGKPPKPQNPAPISAAPPPKASPSRPAPTMVRLPEKVQVNDAVRAALAAFAGKPDSTFRLPPAKPVFHSRPAKPRQGRGPPA